MTQLQEPSICYRAGCWQGNFPKCIVVSYDIAYKFWLALSLLKGMQEAILEEVQELETPIELDGNDQEPETVETVWPSVKNNEPLITVVKPLHVEWRDATQIARTTAEEAEEAVASKSKCHRKKKKIMDTVIVVVDWPLFLPSTVIGRIPQTLKLLDSKFHLCQLLNTQANTTIMSVIMIVNKATARYRVLQEHLVVLHEGMEVSAIGKKDGWDQALHILNDEDIWALDEGDVNDTEALQIKWCKAHACTHHWDEEVTLTLMKMEHIFLFFSVKQNSGSNNQSILVDWSADDPVDELVPDDPIKHSAQEESDQGKKAQKPICCMSDKWITKEGTTSDEIRAEG
ncbi:hypothetical protein ARMSODRAFT_973373 [Armillaria solidipes]|uniref:Uncharacterized protein n=1 Tax=Armillaria solidipes TaxID=1076256 RepID=A0A2H3BLM1_9AGAR|nr:hypothetical protein ARMSODRAFT_973373 [Armillaria solidipes]